MTPASLQHRAAQPPDTTLRIPVAKDDLQKEARVDASPIDVIVSGTVAESCHTSLKGRAIPIDGCLQDLPVEAKTPLKLPHQSISCPELNDIDLPLGELATPAVNDRWRQHFPTAKGGSHRGKPSRKLGSNDKGYSRGSSRDDDVPFSQVKAVMARTTRRTDREAGG